MKVVTGAERRARPELIQPGDREWVTVIRSICAAGYTIPPFIIYKWRPYLCVVRGGRYTARLEALSF